MKKNIILFLSIFIIITLSSTVTGADLQNNITTSSPENQILTYDENPTTYTVNGSAYNQMTDPTIQNTINNAKNGDTILITGKNYVHCHFIINKKLNIISNVGTKMSTCPSNFKGSDGIGPFYIGENGSGTLLSGFTLINTETKVGSVDPYCIYVNNADNITIKNCTVKSTYGPGIYVNGTLNTVIENSKSTNSNNGIYVNNSENIIIKRSIISYNNISGITIGENVKKSLVINNTIQGNDYKGIYYSSCTNGIVRNNKIIDNRDNPIFQRAEKGAGIFIDNNITNLIIKGNFISENGLYGVFNNYNVKNLINENIEIIDNNYFVNHKQRVVFTQLAPEGGTGSIFLWSNYYSLENFCGGTSYAPGVLIGNHWKDLIINNVTQIKKGVYSVSFIRKDTKTIATDLNAVRLTFFLNKIDDYPLATSSDIYKIIDVINGTAIVDFEKKDYNPKDNNLTVVGPGFGPIKYDGTGNRPVAFLKINDSDIPNSYSTTLKGNDLNILHKQKASYDVTLNDDNNEPIVNETIEFEIYGMKYKRITNEKGIAKLNINLNIGKYNITAKFKGNENYCESITRNTITIKDSKLNTTLHSQNLTKIYKTTPPIYRSS